MFLSSSFPLFPHQKALNQFHALQMLFTLLGVKHLLLALTGFLSFPCSLFLSLAACQRQTCRNSGLVWKWSIAHNVPSRWAGGAYSFPVFIDEGHCYSQLFNQTCCNMFFVLSWNFFIVYILSPRVVTENISLRSKDPLQPIKLSTIWKSLLWNSFIMQVVSNNNYKNFHLCHPLTLLLFLLATFSFLEDATFGVILKSL